ncbi:MAG: 6-carboxytetrahydropterin synthase [Bacteroidales bacterium]|nr:6-carboxytetrahydropterin synthase [Bacteroidales bacterium]
MSRIRVTKEFSFEMAHALWNYDGPCKNVHGHSYRLFVTLIGEPINDKNNPKHGMVIDFGDLKRIVNTEIVDRFDHTAVVSSDVEKARLDALNQMFGNVLVVDYQPTCENMVVDIAKRIMPFLPDKVKLHNIRLFETATSYAEWFASDNVDTSTSSGTFE